LFPEDFRNRRKLTCGNCQRKYDKNPQENFGPEMNEFCCPRNVFCKITAGTSAENAAGKSATDLIFAGKSAGNDI